MATKRHGWRSKTYIGGYDSSGALNSFSVTSARDAAESTTFGDSGVKTFVPGMGMHTITTGGLFYTGTDAHEGKIHTAVTTGTTEGLTLATGTSLGDRAYGATAQATQDSVTSPIGALISQTDNWQANNLIVGDLLAPPAVITSTDSEVGTSFTLGAFASGETVGAMFHIIAVSGTGTVAFEIEHSTDSTDGEDGVWDSINTGLVSGNMTAVGYVRATVAAGGVIGPWLRVTPTTFDSFTSVTLLCTAGLVVE